MANGEKKKSDPTQTSYGDFVRDKVAKTKKKKSEKAPETKLLDQDKDSASEKLAKRRKKFKIKPPNLRQLEPEQSEDLADAIGVFTGGSGGEGEGEAGSKSASGPSLVSVAETIKGRKEAKEKQELAQKRARIQAERDAKLDMLIEKSLKA
ncbi:MAG: hypothetical protein GOVbin2277_44 [Prokaryotic dsDNA virus sp.]|jgi:hypothetical protein|nr:MAG: hypothetical protein GOVbin2277_44 [Prokaryotic dsDNA virus sp.]|tara:strand:+ start:251 stop:703 length:453 start_codon:yes stop_codon:yes gene_type:complete